MISFGLHVKLLQDLPIELEWEELDETTGIVTKPTINYSNRFIHSC